MEDPAFLRIQGQDLLRRRQEEFARLRVLPPPYKASTLRNTLRFSQQDLLIKRQRQILEQQKNKCK